VLELLGPSTWRLPRWLDAALPHINIEGAAAHGPAEANDSELDDAAESELVRAQWAPRKTAWVRVSLGL
jgi:hypothetical protein